MPIFTGWPAMPMLSRKVGSATSTETLTRSKYEINRVTKRMTASPTRARVGRAVVAEVAAMDDMENSGERGGRRASGAGSRNDRRGARILSNTDRCVLDTE